MKIKISYILLLSAVVFSGCRKEPINVPVPDNGPVKTDILINMSASVAELQTKTLVGPPKDAEGNPLPGFATIREACNINGTINNSVGFWTDMIYWGEDGSQQHKYDVFNAGGTETKLVYDPSYAASNNGAWTYLQDENSLAQYWSIGASYNFVAYYPQTMSDYVLQASSESSINTFVLSYNTHLVQEDLMVAYNSVHTEDPVKRAPTIYRKKGEPVVKDLVISGGKYGYEDDFELSSENGQTENIPLNFMHTLAAVRFQFKFNYEDSDQLLECWLENDGSENGLHTVGTLVFGVGSQEEYKQTAEYQGLTEEQKIQFEHHEKDDFSWTSYLTTFDGFKMYNWGVKSTNDAYGNPVWEKGVPFSYTPPATEGGAATEVVATAYVEVTGSGGTSILTEEAEKYITHDGWIMFVPQESPGNVTLNYRLMSSGREHTSVTIPKETGTGTKYEAGKLYTYTILIDKTQSYINVSIAPWEEIYSGTEIIF